MADTAVSAIERAGVSVAALGRKLQRDGAAPFVANWDELLRVIEAKSRVVGSGG